MALQPQPRVRNRHRLQPFSSFVQTPVTGRGWIDRLKFSFTGVGLSVQCGPGLLGTALEKRRQRLDMPFKVERPHDRRVEVEFTHSRYLFRLTLSLRFIEGSWTGSGTLEANPTRVLPYLIAAHDRIDVNYIDLVRGERPSISTAHTLDGAENFIPQECLRHAVPLNWCDYTHRYLEKIVETVNHSLGQAVEHNQIARQQDPEVLARRPWTRDLPPPVHEPLVRLPPSHQWSFKEVEVYSECHDENAPSRVAELGQIVRSLSGTFAQDERADSLVHGEAREKNMPVVRVGLGAAGVSLTIYAKAQNRVRFEVCYRRYPMRACQLIAANYATEDTGIRAALQAIRENALRRTAQFLGEFHRHAQQDVPSVADLALALTSTALACGSADSLRQILSLLVINGGLSRTRDADLQRTLRSLVKAGVLRSSRTNLRPGADFGLAPPFEAVFRHLRSLRRP